jgi:anti-sigma regulatory factor (Ser/Thr protein kinase)
VSIFNRFLGQKREQREQNGILPPIANITNLQDMNTRSISAWIAFRLGQILGLKKPDTDTLLLLPFLRNDVDVIQSEGEAKHELISYACRLIDWIRNGDEVYIKLKEAGLSRELHEALLHVYEEVKDEILDYLPQKIKPDNMTPQKDEVWNVYRDVIFAATQQKLQLIPCSEVESYKKGQLICAAEIKERSDIPIARNAAKESLNQAGVPSASIMTQLLLISEAITNILKHAKDGKLLIYDAPSGIFVIVEDTGKGIPLKILPNAVLLSGYSTKKSLGQGFTLMLKMADQIYLATSERGTTLILKFNRPGAGDHVVDK